MLKFFRNIRRKLLAQHKIGQYLKYAAGEIILVVIGILIALQINNWNEERKDKKAEIIALHDLKEEFIYNSQIFDEHLRDKKNIRADWEELISDLSNKSFQNGTEVKTRKRSGTSTYILSQSVSDKLMFTGGIDKIENDSLKYLLTSWENVYKEYQDDEERHQDFFENHFIPYELNFKPHVFFNNGTTNPSANPFHSSEEIDRLMLTAYKDIKYQNLLIRNHYSMTNVVEEGDKLQRTMHTIIELLNKEINSKKE